MEWLSHSHKKHCELCKTPFRFTKLYDANMPDTLPWSVFVRRAVIHAIWGAIRWLRAVVVMTVWAVVLPFLIRWAWRWLFWFADAGWARDAFTAKMRAEDLIRQAQNSGQPETYADAVSAAFQGMLESRQANNSTSQPIALSWMKGLLGLSVHAANSTASAGSQQPWPQADLSLLSDFQPFANLTNSPRVNRFILDVVEGQCITLAVVISFILVFLIREWVVQQQPLVAMENLQGQLQDAAERVRQDNERLQQQQQLLEQARARLVELQQVASMDDIRQGETAVARAKQDFVGWEALEAMIDSATELLDYRPQGTTSDIATDKVEAFQNLADRVTYQVQTAVAAGEKSEDVVERLYQKISALPSHKRQAWEDHLMGEIRDSDLEKFTPQAQSNNSVQEGSSDQGPAVPGLDFSGKAAEIKRMLEEADDDTQEHSAESNERILNTIGDGELRRRLNASHDQNSVLSSDSGSSWQEITPPSEETEETNDPLPIANAGPDAKINIRRGDKGKGRAVPEPRDEPLPSLTTSKSTNESVEADRAERKRKRSSSEGDSARDTSAVKEQATAQQASNPSDGGDANPEDDGSFGATMRIAFREEFGVDEMEEQENVAAVGLDANANPQPEDNEVTDETSRRRPSATNAPARPTRIQRIADWFWGDISPPQTSAEPAPAQADEHVVQDPVREAPFVPVHNGQARPAMPEAVPQAEAPAQPAQAQPGQDPEVVAAAQQAGLDAEAMEEAEDLEGIFELIGMQGPLIGLFQTAVFCTVLITGTVFGAVGLPYIWGKIILSLIGSPVFFFIKMPLQAASFAADLVLDGTLFVGGGTAYWVTKLVEVLLYALAAALPFPKSADPTGLEVVLKVIRSTIEGAATRLVQLFPTTEGNGELAYNWAFLGASIHSHASLRTLQDEITFCAQSFGKGVYSVADSLSTQSLPQLVQQAWLLPLQARKLPQLLSNLLEAGKAYQEPVMRVLRDLRSGSLTVSTGHLQLDMHPSLAYWSPADRTWAVLAGYLALAALAAIYVSIDKPLTRSQSGQKTEKLVRDTIKQAGGVVKVMLIISIEMLVFPLYCGLLLDLAMLPLFDGATVSSRLAFATSSPWMFGFVHWFVGTCYMFHFALFVSMCRKIMRQGVLWFIRDPDDPTFHPVRDVLERNVMTQLRKIAFSALVYGALVILCLGGVVWTIGKIFEGIFPIHWWSTEPIIEFPLDLLLYNFLTPLVIRFFKPSEAVQAAYAWWLRRCARMLRLSHFLFDDRRRDEEGHHVHKSWSSFLTFGKGSIEGAAVPEDRRLTANSQDVEVHFQRDGKYVLTPSSDQYRPPKAGEMFMQVDGDDAYISDKDGKKNEHFTKVYVPPLFRFRVGLFMVCLWFFAAFSGIGMTLLPLVFGRRVLSLFVPENVRMNDVYAYSIGAYILGGALFCIVNCRSGMKKLRKKASSVDALAWLEPAKRVVLQALKCAYFYGFLGVVVPLVFALVLQFYLLLPLHTYLMSAASANDSLPATSVTVNNATEGLTSFMQSGNATSDLNTTSPASPDSIITPHAIHVLQDYALGLLYVRVASRLMITTPTSRAATAFRRITEAGYLNPNARLASRFLVLPLTLLALTVLLFPPILAKASILLAQALGHALTSKAKTLFYRFSYPTSAAAVGCIWFTKELGDATSRWRARIRDEVYLVGERLHNFGEKRPPAGSKSVVRKDK